MSLNLMNDPRDDRDAKIADLIDEARAERRESGRCDTTLQKAGDFQLSAEVADLMGIVEELEAATNDWKGREDTKTASVQATYLCREQRLGRYIIQDMISSGGMGIVYRAQDPQLNRIVAIKVPKLAGSCVPRTELQARFLREARAAAGVRHPNVCPIYDVGEDGDTSYAVMACVEGSTLADLIAAGPIAVPSALEIFAKVAAALGAVHAQKIIHGDLKPRNVLLDEKAEPYLTDFGLSRPETNGESLMSEKVMAGTPAYMAPEQVEGKTELISPLTDIYSIGVLFYQMLTGRLPFAGSSLTLLHQITHSTPPPPSRVRRELDPRLDVVIAKAMARAPAERFGTVEEFAAAVADVAAHAPIARPARTRYWRRFIVGALAASILATIAGVMIYFRDGAPTNEGGSQQTIDAKQKQLDERAAAEWVLKLGASLKIVVDDKERDLGAGAELPSEAFTVTHVVLDNKALTDDDLSRLKPLVRLRELSLAANKLTDKGLDHLRGFRSLQGLNLSHNPIPDAGVKSLRVLELRYLNLQGTEVSDTGLEELKACTRLQGLYLGWSKVTGKGVRHLSDLPALTFLDLSGPQVAADALEQLKRLPHLEVLALTDAPLTDKSLVHLTEMTRLSRLYAGSTPISDAGLAHLGKCRQLVELQIPDTTVSDIGIRHLKGLTTLRFLNLRGSKVSDGAVAELEKAMPDCKIEVGP